MTANTTPSLAALEYVPYLTAEGQIPDQFEGKVGVYAIFDENQVLHYVGFSRDVATSLKQHLVRRPWQCYWIKVQTIDRPSRTLLEGIRDTWLAENGTVPPGNGSDEPLWSQAIDAKLQMTDEERSAYQAGDDLSQVKTLKQIARRVEEKVLADLVERGVKMPIRFDPKLKEEGLLGLK